LFHPNGAGPFPAVVVLHACSGVNKGTARRWAKRLAAEGYLAALPDSFTPRGYANGVCRYGMQVSSYTRAGDAYAVLRDLQHSPLVQPDRVGVIGFSHGGWTVLTAMSRERADKLKADAGVAHDFAAAVAVYPSCEDSFASSSGYRPTAPLLILAGQSDDWTPAKPCESLAERAAAAGDPVSIKVYPGAHHGFDSYAPLTYVAVARRGQGARIAGNSAAREDSIVQVRQFFGHWLKGQPGAASPR
jgi:dienelactone hydrolase